MAGVNILCKIEYLLDWKAIEVAVTFIEINVLRDMHEAVAIVRHENLCRIVRGNFRKCIIPHEAQYETMKFYNER